MTEDEKMTIREYGALADVLRDAYDQAATGKGRERHAPGHDVQELLGAINYIAAAIIVRREQG